MPDTIESERKTAAGQRVAKLALAVVVAGAAIWTLHSYIAALVWAGIFAIATWPLFMRLRQRWPGRAGTALLPLLLTAAIALLIVAPLVLIGVELAREAHGLLDWVDQVRHTGLPLPAWVAHLPYGSTELSQWWQANLGSPGGAARLAGRINRGQVAAYSQQLGLVVAHRLVRFGFMLLTLFFLFRDGLALTAQMRRASARAFGPRGERVGSQIVASVRGTVSGLVLVGLGEGVLIGIGYAISGVPHPTLFGAATAVAAMVPFCAPVVFGVASLLLAAQGSVLAGVLLFIFGAVVTFVADHFVRPVLIGGATRLPFLLVLLGILGGVEAWGLLGLFLGPAIMAVMALLWREFTARVSLDQSSGNG